MPQIHSTASCDARIIPQCLLEDPGQDPGREPSVTPKLRNYF
jgi:hypothetical protein